ncbi:2-(5''-triphosphoribosyl)-3'-dephosphocoenzyme-A synthase [Fundidesulfovibrio magnetotacticus]|uniref:triphosphoribosyl-dephospho-CoA synthase n=1 Tax=Fundidesulfovibrio magnetotacticus TaxID=2730080 RepID=A0A6V8LT32_9BACT|nr:triphosphoribosyl-dephospho-CoA synthase [Fundidesulfovibrio magnetotacticus]GFK92976.1 2-(5''-triphosphoribosyl)-3'-dephosphocoenzyme-A synthase [Fundidesulfovibrio magnetotacticus]
MQSSILPAGTPSWTPWGPEAPPARVLPEAPTGCGLANARAVAPAICPEAIARAACAALLRELATYPKPGLVSFRDSGSHRDMDAGTFLASIKALRSPLRELARAGGQGAELAALRAIGLAAEARMLEATGGVNTHKGAIFCLGLLAAAAGALAAGGRALDFQGLSGHVRTRFGEELAASFPLAARSAGERARSLHGLGGARLEAARGFPSVARAGLPALDEALEAGLPLASGRVHCFFALLETAEDTTLVHRGGLRGLDYARRRARRFNRQGGALARGWEQHALEIHRAFTARNLSAGGVADLLAATLFCRSMETLRWPHSPCSAPGRAAKPRT